MPPRSAVHLGSAAEDTGHNVELTRETAGRRWSSGTGRATHPHLASHWSLDAPDAHLNARGSEDPFLYPALGPRFEHANEPACERTLPRPFGPHCFGGESGHRHPLSILILSPGRLSWLRLPSSSGWEPRPRQGPTGSQRARNSPKQDGCH